jgi:hypothetical protein
LDTSPKSINKNISEADELIKFKSLLDSGVITQDEFDRKKAQILNSDYVESDSFTPDSTLILNSVDNSAKCPLCGSTSLTAHKQGFGIGKAVAGVALTGGIGLAAGGIGANNILVTCLSCGHKYKT